MWRGHTDAYGGCFWGGPYELYVGDLSNVLNFNPHLACIRKLIAAAVNYDIYDVDFLKWDYSELLVRAKMDGGAGEYMVSVADIKEEIARLDTEGDS